MAVADTAHVQGADQSAYRPIAVTAGHIGCRVTVDHLSAQRATQ